MSFKPTLVKTAAFAAAALTGAGLRDFYAGANAVAKAGANAGAYARRSEVQELITCSDDPTRSVQPNPLPGLKTAIDTERCNVASSIDCAGLTAGEVFEKATTCDSSVFKDHLVDTETFQAEDIEVSLPPSTKPTVTPSPSTNPEIKPHTIVTKCKNGSETLRVTDENWYISIVEQAQCTLVDPTCYKNGDIVNATDVARNTLDCSGNQGLQNFLKGLQINAEITAQQEKPTAPAPTPPPPPATPESPTSQSPTSPPPPPAAPEGQPAIQGNKNTSQDENSHQQSNLTRAEIAEILGLQESHNLVTEAENNINGCPKIKAVQALDAARAEGDMPKFFKAFSGAQNLEEAIGAIDCSSRRSGTDKTPPMNTVLEKNSRGAILGTATIVGGACVLAVMGVLGRCLLNRPGSTHVTGNGEEVSADLVNAGQHV